MPCWKVLKTAPFQNLQAKQERGLYLPFLYCCRGEIKVHEPSCPNACFPDSSWQHQDSRTSFLSSQPGFFFLFWVTLGYLEDDKSKRLLHYSPNSNGPWAFPFSITSQTRTENQDSILFLVTMLFLLGEFARQKGWSALNHSGPVAWDVPVFLLDYVIYKISRFPDRRRTEAERSERWSTV